MKTSSNKNISSFQSYSISHNIKKTAPINLITGVKSIFIKGKIDPKELKAAMQSLGFDSKNPTIYQLIADLDTPEAARNGGISFDDFVGAINDKLGDKESKEGIRRIFDLFIDDPNADTITLSSLKKIAQELGENMTAEELKDMLERASANGTELTFDEFYEIMTKKSFP